MSTRMRQLAEQWIQRLGRPMSAAIVFCGIGLFCAVFAVGVNRVVSSRPPSAPGVAAGPGAGPTPSAAAASASPSAAQTAQCVGAATPRGDLKGLVSVAPVEITLTDGAASLAVVIPTGAALDGRASDLHAHVDGAPADQPLRGTLVQDAAICAQAHDATLLRVTVHAGAAVDGQGGSTPTGVVAADIHVVVEGGRSQGGGDDNG